MKRLLPIVALATMGCAPKPPQDVPQPITPVPTQCGEEFVRSFVGLERNAMREQSIGMASKAKTIRWIMPGMAVTMDYRQDRLNVYVDAKGVIVRFSCG